MALISIENLGFYHQKLKEWFSKQTISAMKIIQDKNHKFVTDDQINKWNNLSAGCAIQLYTELPIGHDSIAVDKRYKISYENTWLFIDGIKLIQNKHYTIDTANNLITINQVYENIVDVEVMIFI